MEIRTVHYVELEENNEFYSQDVTFIRSDNGEWYETNGFLADRIDPIDDEIIKLKLEARFWEAMYKNNR